MAKKHLFVGFGELARHIAPRLAARGDQVVGISRGERPALIGVQHWRGDAKSPEVCARVVSEHFDTAIIALSPDRYDEDTYRATYYDTLNVLLSCWEDAEESPRVVFVSSTSVYGQTQGEWVDEHSPAVPRTATAKVLKQCEQRLWESPVPGVVVRFSGIYGPGRDYLLRQVWEGKGGNEKFTNRIHIDDCAAVIDHLLSLPDAQLKALYLASDKSPVKSHDIRAWLAGRLGINPLALANQADSGRGGNKRCDSALLTSSGFQFRYPDYRQGYARAIQEFLLRSQADTN